MPSLQKRKIGTFPGQKYEDSHVPSFLENSPFLPISNGDVEAGLWESESHPSRPTLRQILRSKRLRHVLLCALIFALLLLLRGWVSRNQILGKIGLNGPRCVYNSPPVIPPDLREVDTTSVDWGKFAYTTYATNVEYLCNAVMIFESLSKLGSRASRLMIYDEKWSVEGSGKEGELLRRARDQYAVKLAPVRLLHKDLNIQIWQDSYTKLLAFNQTQFSRLLVLDSDATVLQPMDELFLLPSHSPLIAPRAYWLPTPLLSSHIMLLTPSHQTFSLVQKEIKKAGDGIYDMEIVNRVFGGECKVLPHREYALLTGEFRRKEKEHGAYIGEMEEWDPEREVKRAKYVHFSDHPLPKPWEVMTEKEMWRHILPQRKISQNTIGTRCYGSRFETTQLGTINVSIRYISGQWPFRRPSRTVPPAGSPGYQDEAERDHYYRKYPDEWYSSMINGDKALNTMFSPQKLLNSTLVLAILVFLNLATASPLAAQEAASSPQAAKGLTKRNAACSLHLHYRSDENIMNLNVLAPEGARSAAYSLHLHYRPGGRIIDLKVFAPEGAGALPSLSVTNGTTTCIVAIPVPMALKLKRHREDRIPIFVVPSPPIQTFPSKVQKTLEGIL
ncbi:hypothetical protein G7Y89_g8312 [Cudoniella acicularis]|uniref:Glycosyltransferase family 8 protein n=1 Tax=Cudoniella acicularis TaxID=354080 RepID=A0A8H4RKG2_9HELO|nr:hypothetical protein G7Y89_g8312 [Cudoniella acicularis]